VASQESFIFGYHSVAGISPLQDARRYFHYHHSPAGTFDKVRADELRRNLEVAASLLYAVAHHE